MCSRYVLYDRGKVEQFTLFGKIFQSDFRIRPTNIVPYVVLGEAGEPIVKDGRWGLLPFWVKQLKGARTYHNARIETLLDPAETGYRVFGSSIKRRCLIPMSGFYESPKGDPSKPHLFECPDRDVFFAAGLWRTWRNDDQQVTSFTMITTPPHPSVKAIGHPRSPAVLTESEADTWLYDDQEAALSIPTTPYPGLIEG